MCYNCGCKMPNDAHDKAENITNETIEKASKTMGMSLEDSIKNMRDLADIEIEKHGKDAHQTDLDHEHH